MDMDLVRMMLGRRIAAYRKAAGMTQRALAEAIDVDPARMNRIEKGSEMPTAIQVMALARTLNVSSDDILQTEADEIKSEKMVMIYELLTYSLARITENQEILLAGILAWLALFWSSQT